MGRRRQKGSRIARFIPANAIADLAEGVILAQLGSTPMSRALGSMAWGAVKVALGGTAVRQTRIPAPKRPRTNPAATNAAYGKKARPKEGIMLPDGNEYFPAPKKGKAT